MIAWLINALRWATRQKRIDTLSYDLGLAREAYTALKAEFDTLKLEAADEESALKAQLAEARKQQRELTKQNEDVLADAKNAFAALEPVTRERDEAVRKLHAYMADAPAQREDVAWTDDDRAGLAAFLERNPAGKKLAQHLADRQRDYETAAIVLAGRDHAFALCARAKGFRDCRGEIVRLSAPGPHPGKHEASEAALPPDLEHLRA